MIQIIGTLYRMSVTDVTDRETSEITKSHAAEILHQVRDKTEIVSLKIDPLVFDAWDKFKGRDISAEIRPYAMKNNQGGIQSGYALVDKKSLPTLIRTPAASAS